MNPDQIDPKAGERSYYANIGLESQAHTRAKPFSDGRCGRYLADLGAILEMIEPPSRKILDLGCGVGWTSRLLARRGHTVTGVDISPDAIAAARELAAAEQISNVQFVEGDYEVEIAEASYDFVLFYDTLHHAEDERAALQTAFRALKPNGAVLAFEPGYGHSQAEVSRHAVKKFGVHERDMPPQKIVSTGKAVGFQRSLFLPLPHDMMRSLYRRDYFAAPNRRRLILEKLWGYYRALGWLISQKRGGLTILWK
jgi:SAM-dependent methyltransferase